MAVAAMSKESAYWTPRERFPSASTVRRDLGERLLAQRFLGFADTEEVTGSNPVAPTSKTLTSGNDAALTITVLSRRNAGQFAVWGPVPGTGYRMESVSLA